MSSPSRLLFRRTLFLMVILLSLVLGGQILWFFVLAPRLEIESIRLESDVSFTEAEFLEILNLRKGTLLSFHERSLELRLQRHAEIRKAIVKKEFPRGLRVIIYGRQPLMMSLVNQDNFTRPVVFDEEGVAYQVGSYRGEWNLPLLSGLSLSRISRGAQLPGSLQSLLQGVYQLKQNNPSLLALISEIKVVPRQGEDYELRLYLSHIPIPVRMGRELDGEKLKQAVLVLDVLNALETDSPIVEADFRAEQIVYRYREGS